MDKQKWLCDRVYKTAGTYVETVDCRLYEKKQGKAFQQRGAERLIERVGTDMEMLSNELEKCIGYVGESKLIDVPEVDAICSGVTVSKMFDMIDAVALGEKKTVR